MISEVDIEDMRPVIEVKHVEENEDGSAQCQISCNPAGMLLLLNFGFNALLRKGLDDNPTN